MKNLFDKAFENLEKQRPFVLWANPDATILKAYFQKNNDLEVFENQVGFAFAPFLNTEIYVISENNSNYFEATIIDNPITNSQVEIENKSAEENDFKNLVQEAKTAIAKDFFKKVVLSRTINLDIEIAFEQTFVNNLMSYANSFRYLLYHPKFGLWMGATPERLCKVKNGLFETVSLAGTQLFTSDLHWQTKEKQEQQYVTDYIASQLKPLTENLLIGNTETVQAGKLAHIKTFISGKLKEENNLNELIAAIHPTPAICGLPKNEAQNFIIANENYDRSLYAGFLGEINGNKSCNLYVNLRCMKIEKDAVALFVGCGITKDSDAHLEFMETNNKAQTMLQILKENV